jgi:hypothetical protein
MIIQEMDQEISAHEACHEDISRQRMLEETRDRFEDELRYLQGHYKELVKVPPPAGSSEDAERLRVKRALERVRAELRSIASEHDLLSERVSQRFHPYWGSLLKEQSEMSSFGLQVDLYADVYTRRVSCFRSYSPQQYFRSPYDLMPHEL